MSRVMCLDLATLLKKGEIACDEGRNALAVKYLERALLAASDATVTAHFYLALAYLHLKRLGEAETHAKSVIRMDPKQLNAYLNLGVIKKAGGDISSAIRCYRRELKQNPLCYEAHYNLGLVYLERRKWRPTVFHLEKCWRSKHAASGLEEDLAWAAYRSGKLELEEQIYRVALRTNPRNVWALNNLAAIRNHGKHHQEAKRFLQKAARLAPKDKIVLENLKDTLVILGTGATRQLKRFSL